jgi:hypothetical protein
MPFLDGDLDELQTSIDLSIGSRAKAMNKYWKLPSVDIIIEEASTPLTNGE